MSDKDDVKLYIVYHGNVSGATGRQAIDLPVRDGTKRKLEFSVDPLTAVCRCDITNHPDRDDLVTYVKTALQDDGYYSIVNQLVSEGSIADKVYNLDERNLKLALDNEIDMKKLKLLATEFEKQGHGGRHALVLNRIIELDDQQRKVANIFKNDPKTTEEDSTKETSRLLAFDLEGSVEVIQQNIKECLNSDGSLSKGKVDNLLNKKLSKEEFKEVKETIDRNAPKQDAEENAEGL